MEINTELTQQQKQQVYEAVLRDWCADEINNRLYENNYLKADGIEDLSKGEFEQATDILYENLREYIMERFDWGQEAMYAIDDVVAHRPKEEPKPSKPAPDEYYNKVLAMYGLEDGIAFKIKGCGDLIYHFISGTLFCSKSMDFYRSEISDYTLAAFLFNVTPEDIELIKPQPKDLLNDTLKLIGLETHQPFRIDDAEYPETFYIDSFGDLYVMNKDDMTKDEVHDYLTLGRILTQYHDKIIIDTSVPPLE